MPHRELKILQIVKKTGFKIIIYDDLGSGGTKQRGMTNGAKLGGATGAMALEK